MPKQKQPKRKLVKILFSKTKSGWHGDGTEFYIRVASKIGKMMTFHQFLYEVKQLDWVVHRRRDTHVFKISKTIGD